MPDKMRALSKQDRATLAELYAFIGNALLVPGTKLEPAALDPAFWEALPAFTPEIGEVYRELAAFCRKEPAEETLALELGVEYTRLFIGPPQPVVAPWETLHTGSETLYGVATVAMKRLLEENGLSLASDVHQLEDHVGVELLFLSYLVGQGEETDGTVERFVHERLDTWLHSLLGGLKKHDRGGYYAALVKLVQLHIDWMLQR